MESGLRRNEGLTRKKQTFRVGSLGSGAGELIDGNRPTVEGSVYVLPPSAKADTILDLSRVPRKGNQVIEIVNRSPSYRVGIKGFTSLDGVVIEEHKVVIVLSNTTLRVMWTGTGRAVIKVEPINGLTGFIDWEFGYGGGGTDGEDDGSGDGGILPTPLDPTYSIVPDTISVVEGYPVTFTISTTNVSSGTVLYWKAVAPLGKAVQGNDFVDGALTGSVTISTATVNEVEVGTGVIVREIAEDSNAEVGDAFTLEVRKDSVLGATVAVSPLVTIVDSVGDGGSVEPVYTLTSDTVTVVEGGTVTFTLLALNAPTNAVFSYEILHGDASGSTDPTVNKMTNAYDFVSYSTTGTFSLTINPDTNVGTGTFSINVAGDTLVEAEEYFRVQVKRDGLSVAVSEIITISNVVGEPQPPSYSVTANVDMILEGGVVNFVVGTINVSSGAVLGWRVKSGSTVTGNDFVDGLMNGNITVSNGSAILSRAIRADTVTDDNEVFAIELLNGGAVVATSQEVTVVNVGGTVGVPTYTIVGSKTEVKEGESIEFNVATTNVGSNTQLWWRLKSLDGSSQGSGNQGDPLANLPPITGYELIGFEELSISGKVGGSLTIINNQANFILGIKSNTIVGDKVFAIELLTGSITGNTGVVVASTPLIRVRNIPTPVSGYVITPNSLLVDEGDTVEFTVTGTNIPNGKKLLWQLGSGSEVTGGMIDGASNGEVTMQDGQATFSVELKDEVTTTQKNLIVEIREKPIVAPPPPPPPTGGHHFGLNLAGAAMYWRPARWFNNPVYEVDPAKGLSPQVIAKTRPPVDDDSLFYKPMIEYIQSYNPEVIRFMDLQWTNWYPKNTYLNSWAGRSLPGEYQGNPAKGGLCLEWAIQLADEIGVTPWFHLQHGVYEDPTYIPNFCELLGEWGKPFYLETSNEMWNWGAFFQQTGYAFEIGKQYDVTQQLARGSGIVQSRNAGIVKDLLGDQVSIVLGAWNNGDAFNRELVNTADDQVGIDTFTYMATAPYFGSKVFAEGKAAKSKAEVLKMLREDLDDRMNKWQLNKDVADEAGLQLVAYEGNHHMYDKRKDASGNPIAATLEAVLYPEMEDITFEYLTRAEAINPNGVFCFFQSGPHKHSAESAWSIIREFGDVTPSYKGVMKFLNS